MTTVTHWHSSLSFCLLSCLVYVLSALLPAWGHHNAQHEPAMLRDVGFDQRLEAQVPLALTFRNETGEPVQLRDYVHDKPVILTLAYYDCPNLCTLVLNGLLRAMRALSLTAGEDFHVITVSINPQNTPELAAAKKQQYLRRYGRSSAADGWHFLTGTQEAIQQLTQAVGFRYTYDVAQEQYAHASGIMVLTGQGILARYFYGIEYAARDLQLGLVEASNNKIGSPIDQLLLFCYHYDPEQGKYGLIIMPIIRVAGLTTVLCLGTFMGVMLRRERRQKPGREELR